MKIFSSNRTDYVYNLAKPKKNDWILTIGVANIPELEQKIEKVAKKCVCIDFDKNKINHAKKYLKNTDFIYGDLMNLKDQKINHKFDAIIMLEVLEHIEDDEMAVQIIHSLLNKRGKLIISVPNKNIWHIFNPVKYTQHKRHYSMNEITNLLVKNGFTIEHSNNVESPKLLFDLYIHLFCKYILRQKIKFGILTWQNDKTYMQYNLESKALDSIIVEVKI